MKKILLLILIFSSALWAQSNKDERYKEAQRQRSLWEKEQEEAIKRWREDMQKDRLLIQKYFKSDLFKQFDKEIEKVLKSTDPGLFQNFFDDKNIDRLLKGSDISSDLEEGDFRWIETPLEKILILKMDLKEDAPFEIKIENNHIILKGEVVEEKEEKTEAGSNYYKKSRTVMRTFSVPSGVDASKVKFENKGGKILIKLPKTKVSDIYKRDKRLRPKKKKVPAITPLPKSDGDITI
ncbi:MAG: hypothetical protein ACJAT2_003470 [Bacteriovoracaceae bacterium]|jgi:hypothetical protein